MHCLNSFVFPHSVSGQGQYTERKERRKKKSQNKRKSKDVSSRGSGLLLSKNGDTVPCVRLALTSEVAVCAGSRLTDPTERKRRSWRHQAIRDRAAHHCHCRNNSAVTQLVKKVRPSLNCYSPFLDSPLVVTCTAPCFKIETTLLVYACILLGCRSA
ncbi:hypothetical protein FA10DRAFT_80308 [Acaromyces ingoldii]|uniref:Uncharacterized protein n=1 Tax=Acaromyces ingoldii TaxID=215250 RepID=A0A316YSA1_9BASI|nr:hypothetical protein FA10DRAFT_80308 [Acaromyces ingoldii]PWN92002.1 hypothetical protein FA10DRAFT_80308 [Acaromyces ingoldii]